MIDEVNNIVISLLVLIARVVRYYFLVPNYHHFTVLIFLTTRNQY